MSSLDDFNDIIQRDFSLAEHTWLKVGGPAKYFAQPRNRDELQRLVQCCHANDVSVRVLGHGSNVLVGDDGFDGLVLHLNGDEFSRIDIQGETVTAGCAALLSNLISTTVQAGLTGLEILVGVPGTVGGALRGNAGGREGDIGQFVSSATVLTSAGEEFVRSEDALSFSYRRSSLDELVLLDGSFRLKASDDIDGMTQRMRKIWIMKKASQPLAFQSAGCIFRNPRGLHAGALIEQAGLKGRKVGGAEVSDRHANFIVTNENAQAADVVELISQIQATVEDQFGVELELEIQHW